MVHLLETGDFEMWGHKVANVDLVLRLSKVWNQQKFVLYKVKSHTDWTSLSDLDMVRRSMGNWIADKMANLAVSRCPKWILELADRLANFRKTQRSDMTRIFLYMADLNRERKQMDIERSKLSVSQAASLSEHRNLVCEDAVKLFLSYRVEDGQHVVHDMIDSENLNGSLQGVNLARFILRWAETLAWPHENHVWNNEDPCRVPASWGVSWFELYVNFIITTGVFCPVRVCGSLEKVQFAPYKSDQAKLLPNESRSAVNQCTAFQAACRCVESVLRVKLFPNHVGKGGKVLHRYGFTGHAACLSLRPAFLRQEETITEVHQFIKSSPNKKNLRNNLDAISVYQDLHLPLVSDLTPEKRYRTNKIIHRRRSLA